MTRRLFALGGIALTAVVASAHVGSPDTVFEGMAGPYPVRVVIRTPGVVPGLADISVRVVGGGGGGGKRDEIVTVLPLRGGTPTAALPPADTARAIAGAPGLYSAQLWLMTFGSYSVQVTVAGPRGAGVVNVPVAAVATRRLEMRTGMGIALAGAGLFLFVGLLTIVRAAIAESVLPPGAEPDSGRRRRAWAVTAAAVVLLGSLLWLGSKWWDSEDANFEDSIYRPLSVTTTTRLERGAPVLRLSITDSVWIRRNRTPLIPDHGKLMHLFLVKDDLAAFAHLHPVGLDSNTFDAALPPLPAGTYRVYADIVHESGFPETLVDTVEIGAPAGRPAPWRPTDADDAFSVVSSEPSVLEDGSTMAWERGLEPIVAGQDMELVFAVRERDGRPAALEPYMGLPAHAALTNADGSVFIHLHPLGTISMASQLVFELREPGDTTRGRLGRRITEYQRQAHPEAHGTGAVQFPYSFPKAGRYRVWVQVKRHGRILTGMFDVDVT